MAIIENACRQTLEATEFVTIVTQGEAGPHVVATWGDYIRALGIDNDTLIIPVGYLRETEANLRRDSRVQVLAASRQVQGTHGPGQGCLLTGTARILSDGDLFTKVKEKFPWARGAMLIRVESAKTQL
jgi:predicted pyridoxine 5'-phosphate oxidase superfamily flavin-nucleotide-binding protein